jgi:glycerate 2-kinase
LGTRKKLSFILPMHKVTHPHEDLLSIYNHALFAVNGRKTVAAELLSNPYRTPLALIAIGKAATQMVAGAFDVLGTLIKPALLITKKGHLDKQLLQDEPITCLESAHPVPDATSLAAGQALLEFIKTLPPQYPVLVLISGGASALVEVLAPGMTLTDLQRVNRWLLGSGLDIHAMNQIRKSLSAIKGGRLAHYLTGHPVLNLLISDVPGDDLQAIGSGLLCYQSSMNSEKDSVNCLPDWLGTLMTKACPLAPASCFTNIAQRLIANPQNARQAAGEAAKKLGYSVFNHEALIVGEAQQAGHSLAQTLCHASAGIYVWSSETTVHLPEQPGKGGRCQSLALAAAYELAGLPDVYLLAAGTDGNDGPGEVTGALVDGRTLARGRQKGFDALRCLERTDAGSFLAASGDLIYTGPTGTNVMDILIALKMGNHKVY